MKCAADGTPVALVEYASINEDDAPMTSATKRQRTNLLTDALKKKVEAGMNPEHPSEPRAPDNLALVPAGSAKGAASSSADNLAIAEPAAPSAPNPMAMLEDIHSMVKEAHIDKEQWLKDLPEVAVKGSYVSEQGPPAKGEGNCLRAYWPAKLNKDVVKLPGFHTYLEKNLDKEGANRDNTLLHVGRILGALEITGMDAPSSEEFADVKTLVKFYTSGAWEKLIDIPLLSVKYGWSLGMIDSFALYCQYHLREVTRKIVKAEKGPWDAYANVLRVFMNDVKTGHRKRCVKEKEKQIRSKAKEDLASIKNLPSKDVLQFGVLQGFMVLKDLAQRYAGKEHLPKAARGTANACVAGAIVLDTFAGRKMEWEIMTCKDVKEMLEEDRDYMVCAKHKTSKKYGDLAKWISPGLKECFRCYMSLPRPAGMETFLVPATQDADTVPLHSSLRTFSKRHLPGGKSRPTFNLIRKWFHTALMDLTDTDEKLKKMMKVVDAHSEKVQEKHYILKDSQEREREKEREGKRTG